MPDDGAMRTVTPQVLTDRLAALPANPRAVVSGNFAHPTVLVDALDAAQPAYRLFVLNAQAALPDRDGVVWETPFVGPGMRGGQRLRYLPCRLSQVPLLFAGPVAPDVVLLHTSAVAGDTVSLGVEVNILPAAVEAAHARGALVVAQVNRAMPYTFGDGQLNIADIDLAVEVDLALPSPAAATPDPVAAVIGERVAGMVDNGATLQMGIGGVPDAVAACLVARRGLRVWSEMVSDGVLALEHAGALDGDQAVVASFLFGSPALYEWVDRNPRLRVLRTEKVNDPAAIARHRAMVSVNTALTVDLYGQANASRVHGRIYSGFGGQTDFIVGALHAPGGQALMALRSWHPKADTSTIVGRLEEPVTSFQQTAVVTEQGCAHLWGCAQHEQVDHLIAHAAHPAARDHLRAEAARLGLA